MDTNHSSGYKLSLQPTVPHEHDPSEHTARPGNAQRHAMWLHDNHGESNDDNEQTTTNDYTTSTPGLSRGLSRSLNQQEQDRLAHLDRLKFFLATAPSGWEKSSSAAGSSASSYLPDPANPALNRFLLPSQEFVTCVLWNGLYHITGTDIVRALVFRFEAFGRPVRNMKKFEEGVFSDLRNLKPGVDACLEEPKSPFLDLLFKYQCIRTQKKQKVFYWFSVPHDRLFLDALERDLKREKMGMEPTTVISGEPAMSFVYDKKRSLYEQFTGSKNAGSGGRNASTTSRSSRSVSGSLTRGMGGVSMRDGEGELEWNVRRLEEEGVLGSGAAAVSGSEESDFDGEDAPSSSSRAPQSPFFSMFSLFEGSPTYKQRRKKGNHGPSALGLETERGRTGYPSDLNHDDPMSGGIHIKRESVSAADMFMKQARGELGSAAVPSVSSLPKVDIRDVGVYVEGRLVSGGGVGSGMNITTPPMPTTSGSSSYPASSYDAFGTFQASPNVEMTDSTTSSSGPKTKVFVCPLLSCGRMFKRMEHLKRHLRTHTMERPFVCDKCGKRFSRSDNLGQHLRVHGRADGSGSQGDNQWNSASGPSGSGGDWPNQGGEWVEWIHSDGEESGPDEEFASRQGGIGVGLGMYGPLGMGMGMAPSGADGEWAVAAGNAPSGDMSNYGLNVEMCEMEVSGDVREVQGDEEGLVVGPDTVYDSYPGPGPYPQQQVQGAAGGYYASGYTPTGASGPQTGEPWAPSSAPIDVYRGPQSISSNSSGSGSVYGDDGPYVSMSAPSHKQAFDQSALYPPGVMDTGAGAVRRHRSMTPSIMRNGSGDSTGPVRRPGTASGESPAPRGYHPYAHTGYSSAQSSPSVYPVGLPGSGITRRSSSRASSGYGVEEQMRQMMRSDSTGSSSRPGSSLSLHHGSSYGGDIYRTESPAQFSGGITDSPAAYVTDLPQTTYQPTHAATVPAQFDKHGMFMMDQQQQQQYTTQEGYQYAHPQHVSTM
ncbi:STE-domain-containing protein [Armillaria solidipes]|uniref:STE-domain-containing protein n=1 Tax=Armillaria solidipes TaxID=1076256 RepID=A0A2H3B8R5_9AGAR|nr:STE-domain-containing protein [Armillaria solidipes]